MGDSTIAEELVELLSGDHTVHEILRSLRRHGRQQVLAILGQLADLRLLEDGASPIDTETEPVLAEQLR
jgi:hypothetical protein